MSKPLKHRSGSQQLCTRIALTQNAKFCLQYLSQHMSMKVATTVGEAEGTESQLEDRILRR